MRTKEFLGKLEHDRIAKAIATAEATTSGEIRVFIQRGNVADAVSDARAQFERLGMTQTRERNAVLVFVAPRAQKFAVVGDDGVHQKCGEQFWQDLVGRMREHFQREDFTDALLEAVRSTGSLLAQHFPKTGASTNELPDEIVEG